MTTYRYLTVDEWGGVWVRPPVAEKLLDAECYVHHTAGNPWDQWDAARAFRALNEWATRPKSQGGKGYSFLDYDILVHHNAATDVVTIGEGRGKWLSAATRDRNEEGEAICALGYFHPGHSLSRHPTAGMLEGIALGIVWGINQGWLSHDTKILGHRDNPEHPNATPCPGDYLYPHLPSIRARVAALLAPPTPTPQPDHQEDDMGLRATRLRIRDKDGVLYDNQLVGQLLANPSHANVSGASSLPLREVRIDATRAEIEADLGVKLRPAGG